MVSVCPARTSISIAIEAFSGPVTAGDKNGRAASYLTYQLLTGYAYVVIARTTVKSRGDTGAKDTVVALLRAADRVRRRAARIVEPHGITLQQDTFCASSKAPRKMAFQCSRSPRG